MSNHTREGQVELSVLNPQMVILARQSRGLTQAELASHMGVAQGTVSKVEAGLGQDAPEDFDKLSEALGYPVHFFTQKRRVIGPGITELYHRKREAVSARTLNKVHANAAIRIMNVEDLFRSWEYHAVEVPTLPIGEFEENPEKIARTVRAMWQLPPGPIVNMTTVIEEFGGVVIPMNFETRHIDGFSRRAENLPPVFFINQNLLPDRWRWTLAHELGHMVMHIEPSTKNMEKEADRFAGAFLAPAYEIKPQLWDLSFTKLAGLKQYWKISMQAILMRALQLNVITERKQRYMFMQLSKAGYRMREPAELDPPCESPTLLRRVIAFHRTELSYSDDDLAAALATNTDDIYSNYLQGDPYLRVLK